MALEDGFAWNGTTYRSLSQVARAITGTRWNGRRFFGVAAANGPASLGGPVMTGERKRLRCAVYTRVSTDHGLEQEFNSLDAQREAARAYIKSQAHEGWTAVRDSFDDGGFSGGSLDRPALQLLLDAIRARRIDVVVVYKVDRLTRSLADFAKLVELFDAHGVSFVSVTQSFNTTTSMGRLTLNVLLSFAQFEREVTSERIRDKIAASKRRGLWVGGPVPLGYAAQNKKLVVVEEEAERVRLIFQLYLELGSLGRLLPELRRRGVVTKRRELAGGRVIGGIPFTRGPLAYLLRNRFYLGEVVYRGKVSQGEHAAILEPRAVRRRPGAADAAASWLRPGAGGLAGAAAGPAVRRSRQPDEPDPCQQAGRALPLLRHLRPGAGSARGSGLRRPGLGNAGRTAGAAGPAGASSRSRCRPGSRADRALRRARRPSPDRHRDHAPGRQRRRGSRPDRCGR